MDLSAHFHAVLDYPDEDLDPFRVETMAQVLRDQADALEKLSATQRRGLAVKNGVLCAIVGRPNAGKSSLLNALAGYQRAIVTDIPGTTRDTVEVKVELAGVPFRLVDTAGVRESDDPIEQMGVERSRQAMEKSLRVAAQRLDALRNKRVLTEPGAFLDSRRLDLDRLRDRLLASEERQLAEKRQRFVKLGASLDAMSPLRVLSRGYALATGREGKPLRSVRGLAKGDEITVRFQDGQAACRVEQVQEGEERYGR